MTQGKLYFTELSNQPLVAQLQQLTQLTWDGDLISKQKTEELVKSGLCQKIPNGWNIITAKGVTYLEDLQFIAH